MSKIYRNDFVGQHGSKSFSIETLAGNTEAQAKLQESGLSMERVRRADANRDGMIDAVEAWKIADDFDSDGTRRSLDAVTQGGQTTQAGKTASVLDFLLQKHGEIAPNDDILLVGMNEGSRHEVSQLRSNARGSVTGIHDSRVGDDKIRVGGQTYDLTTDQGVEGFVQTLELPTEQTQKIADVIRGVGADGKDEVAQLAQVWAKGEKGESIPSRMIISGHHVGSAVWGDDNGEISWRDFKGLAEAMPNAAAQIEDVHIAACYSGGAHQRSKYEDIFPNAKTIWAYSGSAPGSWSGATAHMKHWERATRGGGQDVKGTAETLTRWGTRKAENIDAVAVGSPEEIATRSISELQTALQEGEATFANYFTGDSNVVNSQRGELREYYNLIQAGLQHPNIPAEMRNNLESKRDQTIRLLFYNSHIRHRFDEHYKGDIQAGYQSLGLEAPNFSTMTRQQAMHAIDAFRAQAGDGDGNPAAQIALQHLNGLWNLDSNTIPQNWI